MTRTDYTVKDTDYVVFSFPVTGIAWGLLLLLIAVVLYGLFGVAGSLSMGVAGLVSLLCLVSHIVSLFVVQVLLNAAFTARATSDTK